MSHQSHSDTDAERGVIGSIILRPDSIDEIANQLSESSFQLPIYRAVYSAMVQLRNDKKQIAPFTLAPLLKHEVLKEIGGKRGLLELAEEESFGLHVLEYTERVRRAAAKREVLDLCRNIMSSPDNMTDLLRRAAQEKYDKHVNGSFVSFVSALLSGSSDSWPDPEPIPDELHPVQLFDFKLLPSSLRSFVLDITERMQCPPDFPAITILVVLGAVVGRKVGIRPKKKDDWTVVPNLWGGPVGRPSTLKSPAMQEALAPLTQLEINGREKHREELTKFEVKQILSEEFGKARKREIQKASEDPSKALDLARKIVDEIPDPPIRKRFIVNDSTVEKLGELLGENSNGVLVFRDEAVGLLRSLDKEGHESSRAFYLESWNGTGRFTWDRIGRGTIDIESATVSVLGGIQPGPLQAYVMQALEDGIGNDGLLQRFQLLVWPDIDSTWRNIDRRPDAKARQVVTDIVNKLDQATAADFGASTSDNESVLIPYLRFSPKAQVLFDNWREKLENRLRTSDDHPAIESHLTKYRSLVPSLALLLHLAEEGRGPVSHTALERAILWAKYLETHARRVYGTVLSSPVATAHRIRKKILQRKLGSAFSARDVYRPQWSGLTRREAVEEGLELLVDYDWIRPIIKKQGKSRTLYLINPKIYSVPPKDISPNFDVSGKTDPTAKRKPAPTTDNPDAPGSGENAETNLHPTDNTDRTPNPITSPGAAEHDSGQMASGSTDNADTEAKLRPPRQRASDPDQSPPNPIQKTSPLSVFDDESTWPRAQS